MTQRSSSSSRPVQPLARGQRVVLAGDDAQLLVEQRGHVHVVAGIDQRQTQDRDLDVALAQAVEQFGLTFLDHRHEDARVRIDQAIDRHRQERDGRHRHDAHAQAALGAAGQQRQVLRRAAQLVEDGHRARREAAAVHRRLDAVGHAIEEPAAERVPPGSRWPWSPPAASGAAPPRPCESCGARARRRTRAARPSSGAGADAGSGVDRHAVANCSRLNWAEHRSQRVWQSLAAIYRPIQLMASVQRRCKPADHCPGTAT